MTSGFEASPGVTAAGERVGTTREPAGTAHDTAATSGHAGDPGGGPTTAGNGGGSATTGDGAGAAGSGGGGPTTTGHAGGSATTSGGAGSTGTGGGDAGFTGVGGGGAGAAGSGGGGAGSAGTAGQQFGERAQAAAHRGREAVERFGEAAAQRANDAMERVMGRVRNAAEMAEERGVTTIADEVVGKIAGIAAREVAGVHDLGGDFSRGFALLKERVGLGDADGGGQDRGVRVRLDGTTAVIDLTLVIEFGYVVHSVTEAVRGKVITSVENMLGLEVLEVNIRVDDVHVSDKPAQPA